MDILGLILTSIGTIFTIIIFSTKLKEKIFRWIGVVFLIIGLFITFIDDKNKNSDIENLQNIINKNYGLTNKVDKKLDIILKDTILKPSSNFDIKLLQQNTFVNYYNTVYEIAIKDTSKEKRYFYSNLITSFIRNYDSISINNFYFTNYNDYLKIINDLSSSELIILRTLEDYEKYAPKINDKNEIQITMTYWDKFKNDIIKRTKIPITELNSIFLRLERSGCFQIYSGYIGQSDSEVIGHLTPLYYNIINLIAKNKI